MSNTIEFKLCAEDRARLDKIIELLEGTKITTEKATHATIKKPSQKAPKAEPRETEPTQAETEPTPENSDDAGAIVEQPDVTLEQIHQKVIQLVTGFGGAKKAQTKAIINTYAPKTSEIPADKWQEVWDQLLALESEG